MAIVGVGIFRIEHDRLLVVGKRVIEIALELVGRGAVVVGDGILLIELDHHAEIRGGVIVVALVQRGIGAVFEARCVDRIAAKRGFAVAAVAQHGAGLGACRTRHLAALVHRQRIGGLARLGKRQADAVRIELCILRQREAAVMERADDLAGLVRGLGGL
jgi:hypothetical protein